MRFRWLDNLLQRPGAYASTFALLRDLGVLALLLGGWTWVVQTIAGIHSYGAGVWLILALFLTTISVATLLGVKALMQPSTPLGAVVRNPRRRYWPRESFVEIDLINPWREVRDAGNVVGMKYCARLTFKKTVETMKVRLSFFEEVHLAFSPGVVIQPLGVISHIYQRPHFRGDTFDVELYSRMYGMPTAMVCGENSAILANEGRNHKVVIECIIGDRVQADEFAIFPARSDRPFAQVIDATTVSTTVNSHRPPPSFEVVHK